jgi:hypothetical protein
LAVLSTVKLKVAVLPGPMVAGAKTLEKVGLSCWATAAPDTASAKELGESRSSV